MLTTTLDERLDDLAAAEQLVELAETTRTLDPGRVHRVLRERWGDVAPVLLQDGIPAWLALGHQEVAEVLRSERLFSRDAMVWTHLGRLGPASAALLSPRDSIYYVDGGRHRELRQQLDDALEGLDEHALAAQVRQWCEALLARVRAEGSADLVADYAMAVPLLALSALVGLDQEQARAVAGHARTLHTAAGPEAAAALLAQRQIVQDHVMARLARPADDVTSRLVHHPSCPTVTDAATTISTMLLLGNEFAVAWIAQTLRLVLTDPRYDGHRGGILSAAEALDDVLWRYPPATNGMPRFATTDCLLGGRRIARGDAVVLAIHGANQDDDVRADDLWLEVGNRSHMTWGAGPHSCPVRRPARLVTQTAVDVVLRDLGGMALAVDPADLVPVGSVWCTFPASLPVRFAARRA